VSLAAQVPVSDAADDDDEPEKEVNLKPAFFTYTAEEEPEDS